MLCKTEYGHFKYFDPDIIGKTIAAGQFWDEHFKPYMDEMHQGSVFVDVGANIGFFTVYCAKRGARVYSFEPALALHGCLVHNVMMNGVQGLCSCSNMALFSTTGFLKVNPACLEDKPLNVAGDIDYTKAGNSGGLSLLKAETKEEAQYFAITLDSLNLERVDLIKIDTQGADLRVLEGAICTIERCKPVICFEVEPIPAALHGDTFDKYFTFFDQIGYKVTQLREADYGSKDFVAEPIR